MRASYTNALVRSNTRQGAEHTRTSYQLLRRALLPDVVLLLGFERLHRFSRALALDLELVDRLFGLELRLPQRVFCARNMLLELRHATSVLLDFGFARLEDRSKLCGARFVLFCKRRVCRRLLNECLCCLELERELIHAVLRQCVRTKTWRLRHERWLLGDSLVSQPHTLVYLERNLVLLPRRPLVSKSAQTTATATLRRHRAATTPEPHTRASKSLSHLAVTAL